MVEESISQEFRLKNIEDIKIRFIKQIDQNELMINRHKKVCKTLNYIKQFLILVTGCVSISAFSSLLGIPIRGASSAIELKICARTVVIKTYMSISKRKE